MKGVPLLVLTLLLGLGAAMLFRMPVRRYVVRCERTTLVACDLEHTRSTGTQRWHVQLGPGASAVVRVVPRRRGTARVFLYLESATGATFAAEFEGADAQAAAERAAAQLNQVFEASGPADARIEVSPPPLLGWLAWGALGVMGLLVVATYRDMRSRARVA